MLFLNHLKQSLSPALKLDYKTITPSRFDQVIDHLRNSFFLDEPLNAAVALCKPDERHHDIEKECYGTLEELVSHMAVNENNEIVGVLLNGAIQNDYIDLNEKSLEEICDLNYKKITHFLNMVNKKANIFERFDVDKIFDVRILSVDERFRGLGISKELLKRSEKLARECDFKLMKAEATGVFSQKILKSHGFEVLEEYYYDKWVDENGKQIFKVELPHTKLEMVIKCLK